MTPIPRYDDTIDRPLRTGEDILERVHELVGPACRAQTWLLFLDADDVQLPLLVPIDDVPPDDRPLVDTAREVLSVMMTATDAASVIVVIESPSTRELTAPDRDWAIALRDGAAAEGIDLRALLLSHDHGVRAIAPDDLLPVE